MRSSDTSANPELANTDTGFLSRPALQVNIKHAEPIHLDVSLQCGQGEMLALVGPSGSGKSTVLRSIAGLHRANEVHIQCGNETWDNTQAGLYKTPQQRSVGLVFQDYALFPHKSVLQNVMLASPCRTKAQRRSKSLALLEKTNMTGLEHRMPNALSGGQRQRVALARALAREPRALLLDEPFSAVDQQTRRKLYAELASLRQSLAMPIVLVTHDMTEVQLLADSLCLIHHGKTLEQGKVIDVINQPRTRSIARLVGHQNLFSAKVTGHTANATCYKLGQLEPVEGPRLPGLKAGDDVCLLIKPSAIRMSPVISSFALEGHVQESVLLGDEMSIRLHLERVPKSLRFKLSADEARSRGIEKGCKLKVYIQRETIHVLAE